MDASEVVAELSAQFPIKKKKVSVSSNDDHGKLDCSLPTTLMQSILGETKLDDFVKTYWEKKPLVVKRKDAGFYGDVLALQTIKEVITNNELEYETDINVSRVVDNNKELLNEDGPIKVEDIERLLKEEKATIQFQHPQRYVDGLWNVVEKLETYFGCLVGACVYVTPAKSQGVSPHCDDVDNFHLQLEGSQKWQLYKPMVELSRDYTQDLTMESIGEPILEVTLEAGDMLYFPRGVIYQSMNEGGDKHSTHISISSYQQNTWGDFMNHAVQQAIENALEHDVSIRSGLPINYLSLLGTGKDMNSYVEDETDEKEKKKYSNLNNKQVVEFKEKVKVQLAKLVDHIDVNTASDAMCADFYCSRLPPYGHVKKEESEDEVLPTLENKIKIKYPEHVRIVYDDDEEGDQDDDEDEDDEDEESDGDEEMDEEKPTSTDTPKEKEQKSPKVSGTKSPKKSKKKSIGGEEEEDEDEDEEADVDDAQPHVKILHTLDNDRFTHMSGGVYDTESGCIRLHVSFAKAAVELLDNCDKFTAVKDILMEDDEDKITLATLLCESDLIEIQG